MQVSTLWQLIAGRAWVGTLGLVIFWGMLGFGQSRELLFGIGEMLWLAEHGQLVPGFHSFGWTIYISFWLSALVLAVVFGIAVRVTSFPPPRQAPAADASAELNLRPIYPHLVAIAALVIAHNAFAREQPLAAGWLAPVFMLAAVVPTIFFPAVPANRRQMVRFAMPVAILAIAAIWVFSAGLGLHSSMAILLSIATPALFGWLPWPHWSDQTWRSILIGAGLLLLILLFGPWPTTLPLAVGSVAVALVALSFIIVAVAVIVLARARLRIDALLAVVLVGVGVWLLPERFGNERLEDAAPPACAADTSCVQAGAGAANPDHRLPIGFALHADGGGIRAALYTAQLLALADDVTCGEFGRYVFAASGVSGGALGIATWAALRQDYVSEAADQAWTDCKAARDRSRSASGANVDLESYPLFDQANYTLAQDHLSTVLASMVAWDRIPWGWASRGQALVQSWQETATLAAGGFTSSPIAFARLLRDANAGVQPAPRLYFTSTDADSGKRVVFSNADMPNDAYHQRLQLGVAALNSARFPIISPAGLSYDAARHTWIRVVDGGYFDNSGAATLLDALHRMPAVALPKTLVIARINGNAAEDGSRCGPLLAEKNMTTAAMPTATSTWDPLDEARHRLVQKGWSGTSAYNGTRGARAEEAVHNLREATFAGVTVQHAPEIRLDFEAYLMLGCLGEDAATCRTWLEAACPAVMRQRQAPLGWYLSQAVAEPMGRSAFIGLRSLLSPLGPYLGAKFGFNTHHRMLRTGP